MGRRGRIYDLEEAVRTAHRWMTERAARGEPFLSGMFTRGEVVYADPEGGAASHREAWSVVVNPRLSAREVDLIREHSGARRPFIRSRCPTPRANMHRSLMWQGSARRVPICSR